MRGQREDHDEFTNLQIKRAGYEFFHVDCAVTLRRLCVFVERAGPTAWSAAEAAR
jgi:hypothetical protein